MDTLDSGLGVNVGNLMGHSAIRYYVMGDAAQERAATDEEIEEMRTVVRDGMLAGALGLSISRNAGHFDPRGVNVPALWAEEKEIFAICDVLRELGTGIIQSGGGNGAEVKTGLMSRLSEATGGKFLSSGVQQTLACRIGTHGSRFP
jgi:N-acyl-D-aspartate/D-glutamate deacylase